MDELMPSIMDHFAKMPNSAGKTAEVLKVFGRSGMELLPFLNQGSAGLAKFTEEAKKNGLILSQDSLDGLKANVMAQREFHAAIEGVQVSLGQALYPAITKMMEAFTKVIPYVREFVEILVKLLKPAIEIVAKAIAPLAEIFGSLLDMITGKAKDGGEKIKTEFGKWGEAAWKWVQDVYPKLIAGLENLVAKFITWFDGALPKILDQLDHWRRAFIEWVPKAVSGLLNEAAKLANSLVDWIGIHGKDIVAGLIHWSAEFSLFLIKAIPPMLVNLAKLVGEITIWLITKGVPLIIKATWNIGKALIEGIWQGILENTSMFLSKMKDWVENHIPGFLKKLLGIASPSKVTNQIGGFIVQGLIQGIEGNVAGITSSMTKVSNAIVNGFKGTTPKVVAAMQATINAAKSAISRFSSDISAIYGVGGAQSAITSAQGSLSALSAEKASLPSAISEAMAALQTAQSLSPLQQQSAYEDAQATYQAALDANGQQLLDVAHAQNKLNEVLADPQHTLADVTSAEADLNAARKASLQPAYSPAKLALLEYALNQARLNLNKPSQDVIDAEKNLADLRKRAIEIDNDIIKAQQELTKANVDLVAAELDAKLAKIDLKEAVKSLGIAAGLSATQITALLGSIASIGSISKAQTDSLTSNSGTAIVTPVPNSTGGTFSSLPDYASLSDPRFAPIKFAKGGIVTKPTNALIGEAGENEAVIPLSRMSGLGGITVNLNVHGSVTSERDLAVTIRDNIAQLMRRRGLDPAILGV
jgi:hypothetical protein